MQLTTITVPYIILVTFLILLTTTIRLCRRKFSSKAVTTIFRGQVVFIEIRWPLRTPKGPPTAFKLEFHQKRLAIAGYSRWHHSVPYVIL